MHVNMIIVNILITKRKILAKNYKFAFSDTLDSLEEQVKVFFKKCAQPNVKQEWKDEQFKKIHEVSFKVGCKKYILDI